MADNDNLVSTKQMDYLDEDKQIRGQNYCLLSFISPEEAADVGLEFIAEVFEGDFFVEVGESEVGEEVIAAELPGGFEGSVAESGGEDAGDGAGRADL